jgi:hypothetical protein
MDSSLSRTANGRSPRSPCVCKLILSKTYSILLVLLSYLHVASHRQPGDPDNKDVEEMRAKPEYKDFDFPLYEDHCLEVECPGVVFTFLNRSVISLAGALRM